MDKMKRPWTVIVSIVGGIITGLVVCLLAFKVFPNEMLNLVGAKPKQTTPEVQASPQQLKAPPEVALNDNVGALIDHLKQEHGYTLDHYSLTYLVIADQQVIGLLRTIKESTVHPDIKQFATEVIEQRQADVTRLLLMQKLLGHNHH